MDVQLLTAYEKSQLVERQPLAVAVAQRLDGERRVHDPLTATPHG